MVVVFVELANTKGLIDVNGSFTAEMFRGDFRWDLMHPYPEQDAEDKKIGDE